MWVWMVGLSDRMRSERQGYFWRRLNVSIDVIERIAYLYTAEPPFCVLLFYAVALGLTADELFIVEVVDLHGAAHLVHGLGSGLAGTLGSLP